MTEDNEIEELKAKGLNPPEDLSTLDDAAIAAIAERKELQAKVSTVSERAFAEKVRVARNTNRDLSDLDPEQIRARMAEEEVKIVEGQEKRERRRKIDVEARSERWQKLVAPTWRHANIDVLPAELRDMSNDWLGELADAPKNLIMTGPTGSGKALRNDQPVLTTRGWVSIGLIEEGDSVYGASGNPVKVLAKYPQGVKQTYAVNFSDGGSVIADGEHLWTVFHKDAKSLGSDFRHVMTTEELLESGLRYSGSGGFKWFIPIASPVGMDVISDKSLPIDPYTLGALLGDGCFRSLTPSISSADPEIINYLELQDLTLARSGDYDYITRSGGKRNWLKWELVRLGLWGKYSYEKEIPEQYMLAPAIDRLALLRGLMDTDGTVNDHGSGCEFSSSSEVLANQVATLTRSLGGVTGWGGRGVSPRETSGRLNYRLNIMIDNFNPFLLDRKASKWKPANVARSIHSITPVGYAETTCITVDDIEGLFITKDYIVTHNTFCSFAIYRALYVDRFDVKLTHISDMLDAIREASNQNSELGKYKFPNCLILDDFGSEKRNEWVNERLNLLFDYRWQWRLPTVITTNVPATNLFEAFGDRIASRLLDKAIVYEIKGSDRRIG